MQSSAFGTAAFVLIAVLSLESAPPAKGVALSQEPACQALTPTAVGGPAPKSPNTLVLRWLGTSNHELAYRDNVILFDAYYERAPRTRPIGLTFLDMATYPLFMAIRDTMPSAGRV